MYGTSVSSSRGGERGTSLQATFVFASPSSHVRCNCWWPRVQCWLRLRSTPARSTSLRMHPAQLKCSHNCEGWHNCQTAREGITARLRGGCCTRLNNRGRR